MSLAASKAPAPEVLAPEAPAGPDAGTAQPAATWADGVGQLGLVAARPGRYNHPMGHEIEAKYRVSSFAPVRRALERQGGRLLMRAIQTDRYFDTPGRLLLGQDRGVRLRTLKAARAGEAAVDPRPQLTYKGPRRRGGVKSRPEHQTRLDDADAAVELLGALGLSATLTVQKRRASYRLGRCVVELDELPVIGRFVEIEGPSSAAVLRTARRLGLAGPPIGDHYINLLRHACLRIDQDCAEITFARCGRGRCRRRRAQR